MTTYGLTKRAKECKGNGTHATVVIQALKALNGNTRLAVGKLYGSVVKLGEVTRWEDRDKSIDLSPKTVAQSPTDDGHEA